VSVGWRVEADDPNAVDVRERPLAVHAFGAPIPRDRRILPPARAVFRPRPCTKLKEFGPGGPRIP
jgi:hypothetical protein